MPEPYHSALHDESYYPQIFRVDSGRSTAFVHDVTTGMLPPEFDRCDVFYTDLPWKDGVSVFDERMGIEGRKYADFMHAVAKIVVSVLPRPVVLITGKSSLKYLPMVDGVYPTKLNGADAVAACWRVSPVKQWKTTRNVLEDLASRYTVAGDFCCGYGRVAEYFKEPERSCVMSDYNPRCIGGVAERFKA